MESLTIHPSTSLTGTLNVPGDKSISHRALIFGAIAQGQTVVDGILDAEDVRATANALQALGASVDLQKDQTIIEGVGLHGLKTPADAIDLGNSGTSIRLLLGLLAGQNFSSTVTGDASLCRRPMGRVTVPLRQMGARIAGANEGNLAPLTVEGHPLTGLELTLAIPSAQVKSALLLAGLYANSTTTIQEPLATRDHTERMLQKMGNHLQVESTTNGGRILILRPGDELQAQHFQIPGDFSSAAFWLVAGILVPGSQLTLTRVGLNATRTGLIKILKQMGAKVSVKTTAGEDWEPTGEVTVTAGSLKGTVVKEEELPGLIDELPILMVAASCAEGRTTIENARELRVKETDRIDAMVTNLKALGVNIQVDQDTIVIDGPARLHQGVVSSFGDHRTAMSMAIAGLVTEGGVTIEGVECIQTSYPGFPALIQQFSGGKN